MENRPSKKQKELLSFIDGFVRGNGYGPSYREIMRALDYKSVSTVAVHIDGLITRGLLRKTNNSARSLEIVAEGEYTDTSNLQKEDTHIAWLRNEITKRHESEDVLKGKEARLLEDALAILSRSQGESEGIPS